MKHIPEHDQVLMAWADALRELTDDVERWTAPLVIQGAATLVRGSRASIEATRAGEAPASTPMPMLNIVLDTTQIAFFAAPHCMTGRTAWVAIDGLADTRGTRLSRSLDGSRSSWELVEYLPEVRAVSHRPLTGESFQKLLEEAASSATPPRLLVPPAPNHHRGPGA